jgi:hypothetical protein
MKKKWAFPGKQGENRRGSLFFVTIQSQGIFENFFGEKPHEQVAKRIANGALNSYKKLKRN